MKALWIALILISSAHAADKDESFEPDNAVMKERRRIAKCVDKKMVEQAVGRNDRAKIMDLKKTCREPGDIEPEAQVKALKK